MNIANLFLRKFIFSVGKLELGLKIYDKQEFSLQRLVKNE